MIAEKYDSGRLTQKAVSGRLEIGYIRRWQKEWKDWKPGL